MVYRFLYFKTVRWLYFPFSYAGNIFYSLNLKRKSTESMPELHCMMQATRSNITLTSFVECQTWST